MELGKSASKTTVVLYLSLFLGLSADAWAESERFTAPLPSAQWEWEKTLPAGVPAQTVHLYLKKKGSASSILLRAARKGEFGIPTYFELEDDEFAYLVKVLPKGSYLGEVSLSLNNPALPQLKGFKFSGQHPALGECQDVLLMQKGKDIILIELLTKAADYEKDVGDLKTFLAGLKDQGAK